MHYLVDGYNLAHWLAREEDLGPEQLRRLLVDALVQRRPRDAEALTIYWDSRDAQHRAPQNEYSGGMEQRYVPVADDAIIDAVADHRDPGSLTVVSRDREVTGRSRQLGARIAAPADLLGGGSQRDRTRGRSGRRPRGR